VDDDFLYDGAIRTFRLYIPVAYDPSQSVPLVLNLHGYGSNNLEQEFYGDFRPIADTANFILVHPNGTTDALGNRFWNTFGTSTVDDIGFLSALIDTISSGYAIDQNRIYSTGMSNGGFMSYEQACFLSDRIAAVASVAGTMITSHLNSCNPLHPTPVMHIHGTADGTVPYDGNVLFVGVIDLLQYWVQFNNCMVMPEITSLPDIDPDDGCTAERHYYSGGNAGSAFDLYQILGGGHSWPGAPVNLNVTNMDFSASLAIWDFFRQFRLDELSTGIADRYSESSLFSVYPNPSQGQIKLDFNGLARRTVTVTTIFGQVIMQYECSSPDSEFFLKEKGVCMIRVIQDLYVQTEKIVVN
jgi:polyhydroxybutyrate depolymerase